MSFQISALSADAFSPLFALTDAELAARGGVRRVADRVPGFPCRVSLRDAAIGEAVLLVHYEHHPVASPFRASYAIYVRPGATQARLQPDEVPEMLRSRLLSLRAFSGDGLLVDADVVEGLAVESAIGRLLGATNVNYVHIHFAKAGCFAARAHRA
jgi:hypothetical protein